MAYEQRDNSGSLFKNNKPRNEKSPPLTGSARIDGVEYFFDAWRKSDKNGNEWFSCAFKKKDKQAGATQPQAGGAAFDDDIPFSSEKRINWI